MSCNLTSCIVMWYVYPINILKKILYLTMVVIYIAQSKDKSEIVTLFIIQNAAVSLAGTGLVNRIYCSFIDTTTPSWIFLVRDVSLVLSIILF